MLKAYPRYECGTGPRGAHWGGMSVYALAMTVIVIYGVAYPVLSLVAQWHINAKRVRARAKSFQLEQRHQRIWDELRNDEYLVRCCRTLFAAPLLLLALQLIEHLRAEDARRELVREEGLGRGCGDRLGRIKVCDFLAVVDAKDIERLRQ